jgi:hypothetical protein
MRIIRAVPERGTVNLPFLASSATRLLPSSLPAHVQGNIILYIYTRNFQRYITGRITTGEVMVLVQVIRYLFILNKILISSLINRVHYY